MIGDDDHTLTDEEADRILLSLRNRLTAAMVLGQHEVLLPRYELLLAQGLAANMRSLMDAVLKGATSFELRGITYVRTQPTEPETDSN